MTDEAIVHTKPHLLLGRLRRGLLEPSRRTAGSFSLLIAFASMLPMQAQQPSQAGNHDEVIAYMEQANSARQKALQSYQGLRRYNAANSLLGRRATLVVEMKYAAPDQKNFRVLERSGSHTIQTHAIEPLMNSETEASLQQEKWNTDISRQNYIFTFMGMDTANQAFTFKVEPRTPNKYLFRGMLWIDPLSYGIMRIEGEPAKSPSFWVKKTHFVHQYGSFGGFWFPISNRTEVELRIFGKSTLSIDYYGYEWKTVAAAIAK